MTRMGMAQQVGRGQGQVVVGGPRLMQTSANSGVPIPSHQQAAAVRFQQLQQAQQQVVPAASTSVSSTPTVSITSTVSIFKVPEVWFAFATACMMLPMPYGLPEILICSVSTETYALKWDFSRRPLNPTSTAK